MIETETNDKAASIGTTPLDAASIFYRTKWLWDLQSASLPDQFLGGIDLLQFLLGSPAHILTERGHTVGVVFNATAR